MIDCVIIDIDGTIADPKHRLHYIKNGNKDYDSFNSAVLLDQPIDDVIFIVNLLVTSYHERKDFDLIICSGRPEDQKNLTYDWLLKYVPRLYKVSKLILLRKSGDYRKDAIVKDEMRQFIQKFYNIRAVLDDRQQCVDMWRKNGITCLQVAQWDEERSSEQAEPGTLHLMIGPSGAGKSVLAANLFPHNQVISSDDLRKQLTGNFNDMSKDEIMWKLLHKLVAARLEAGADTVVDATNLRNRNRKSLRDLQLPNGKIVYHIMNRDMKQKVLTGGWRNDVIIKNQPLMEYHEQTFRSNCNDILRGDGDERVEVKDHRFGNGNGLVSI